MGVITIGELAATTGVPATTIRYYERVGVLPPPVRAANGYRTYRASDVDRVRFVARARALAVPVASLVTWGSAWDDRDCVALRRDLAASVDDAIATIDERSAGLAARRDRLERDRHWLRSGRATRCDRSCPCVVEPPEPATDPDVEDDRATAVVCTLPVESVDARLTSWQAVAVAAAHTTPIPGGIRLDLGDDVDLPALAGLIADETECCSFLRFRLEVDARDVALEITGPPAAGDVIHAIVGVGDDPVDPSEWASEIGGCGSEGSC